MHMIGHGVALDQFNPLLLAQLPDDPPDTASELPIEDPASVLRHKNNVILAVPADVRLALPVSHENLLPSERGGSLKGGSLLHSAARRNGRASASLTARGGGLPVGVSLAALPLVGPVGLSSPPSSGLGSATTATLPLSGRFAWRSLPDTWPTSVRACCP